MVQHAHINKHNTTHKQNKDKTHTILSIHAEKTSDKIQHVFMIKALKKLGTEDTFLNIIKAIYNKSITDIIFNGEKLKPSPLKSRMRHSCST
jgi:2-iminoacetate synthase ThiH